MTPITEPRIPRLIGGPRFETHHPGDVLPASSSSLKEASAYRFTTRIHGRDLTAGVVLRGPSDEHVVRSYAADTRSASAATDGKIAILDTAQERLRVQQLLSDHRAPIAWCGNACAAAVATLGNWAGSLTIDGPDGRSALGRFVVRGGLVSQAWSIDGFQPPDRRTSDGVEIAASQMLNSYLIVRGPVLPGFGEQLLARETETNENAKVVVVGNRNGLQHVRFHTKRGHAGAPMTGLAELALVRQFVPWLSERLRDGYVVTSLGIEPLPHVAERSGSVEVLLPPVSVELQPLEAADVC